jgi:hypothetical protein
MSADLEADVIARSEYAAVLRAMQQKLAPRFERLLRLRLGINCEPHTLERIAELYGLSRARIQQMEAKALRIMRWHLRSWFPRGVLATEACERGHFVHVIARDRLRQLERDRAGEAIRVRQAHVYYYTVALNILGNIWDRHVMDIEHAAFTREELGVAAIRKAYIAALGTPDEQRLHQEYARALGSMLRWDPKFIVL